jgi:uncharacterized protein (UPF0264 family)
MPPKCTLSDAAEAGAAMSAAMAATAIDDAASLIDDIPESSLKRFLRGSHNLSLSGVEGQPPVARAR